MTIVELGKQINLVEFINYNGVVVHEVTRWSLEGFSDPNNCYSAWCRAQMDESVGDFTYSNMRVSLNSGEVFYALPPSITSIYTKWKSSHGAVGNRVSMKVFVEIKA